VNLTVIQFNDVFYKWGLLFSQSFYFTNPNEHLYMDTVNLNDNQVKELTSISPNITVNSSNIEFEKSVHVPTFMANRKVRIFLDVLSKVEADKYILIDADMLFRKSIDKLYGKLDDSDAAVIFRDGVWEGRIYEHLKVASGIVAITKKGIPFIKEWDRIMYNNIGIYGYRPWAWYWDQITLLEATRKINNIKYAPIEPWLYINREFGEDAIIWSANLEPKDRMYEMFGKELERIKHARAS